jgi:hypothetical protein
MNTDELYRRATKGESGQALAEVLAEVERFLRSYVVAGEAQIVAVVLWAAHTFVCEAAEQSPYLAVTSPEKRSGKTRLLETLELLVSNPWRVVLPSEAVLYRKLHRDKPTLMLDESDAIFRDHSPRYEPLRGLLNAANRRGTTVPRCLEQGGKLIDFEVFGPKVLAGIGDLPDTVADRAVPIRLKRRAPGEAVMRFRCREADAAAAPIRERLEAWAGANLEGLSAARPSVPNLGDDDRAAETWEPLLAIADAAGGDWPRQAREAAVSLHGDVDTQRESEGIRLLADIRDVFDLRGTDRMFSADLAKALGELEESPWGDLRGRALDSPGLARRLRPMEIRPRTIRIEPDRAKGYFRADFEDAWSRYLSSRQKPDSGRDAVTSQVRPRIPPGGPEALSGPKRASDQASHGVTAETLDRAVTALRGAFPGSVVLEEDVPGIKSAVYTEADREEVRVRYEGLRRVYEEGGGARGKDAP